VTHAMRKRAGNFPGSVERGAAKQAALSTPRVHHVEEFNQTLDVPRLPRVMPHPETYQDTTCARIPPAHFSLPPAASAANRLWVAQGTKL
jgi:hypothetical protein